MAEDQVGLRSNQPRELPLWTKLFSGFKVALDPKKLLLAAAGILVMSAGWYVLSAAYYGMSGKIPEWSDYQSNVASYAGETPQEKTDNAWNDFKLARSRWDLMYRMAAWQPNLLDANQTPGVKYDDADAAKTYEQFKAIEQAKNKPALVGKYRPAGEFRTWPWFEPRGPNPFLLVTGGVKQTGPGGTVRTEPWEALGFMHWFFGDEVPVLLEPLVKFLRPIVYLINPGAGGWNVVYLILVILWTLATWALFGGAITRMAAVQVARTNEKIGMTEALRFARARIQGYFSAPLLPLVFLAILTVFLWLYGLVGAWTWAFGDVLVYGLFAPIMLLIGLIMAVVLVGLVGWPLMYSTISTEGSDSFDAISRSYSYVYQAPWQYLWYTAVALVYGAVLVFFIGLMGSLTVYLGKWGISQAPSRWLDRDPSYLFVYAPTSFGWRDLLLEGSAVDVSQMKWNNHIGAVLVSVWIWLFFLLIVGFGYSYFWSASTIIYLFMRRKVDDTELDEIHLEEEELEEPYAAPGTTAAAPASPVAKPAPTGAAVTMVEPPSLRTPTPAVVSATAPPAPAATPGGNQEHTGPAAGAPTTHTTEGDKP